MPSSSSSSCSSCSSSFSSSSSSNSRRPVTQMAGDGIAGDTLYTHLNLTGNQRAVLATYGGPTFIYDLSEQVSDRLIMVLQDFFQATTIGKNFNYALARVHKEVKILDQFAIDTVGLPQIVVTSIPSDNVPLSFGNRLGQDTYGDQIFNIYGGKAIMNTTLELYDSGKPNVQSLADITFLALMEYVLNHMGSTMMFVDTPKIRFTNVTKTPSRAVGGEIYMIRLTVPILSEWRQYLEQTTLDAGAIKRTWALTSSSLSSEINVHTKK